MTRSECMSLCGRIETNMSALSEAMRDVYQVKFLDVLDLSDEADDISENMMAAVNCAEEASAYFSAAMRLLRAKVQSLNTPKRTICKRHRKP